MNSDTLNSIYDKTNGHCHLCHKKLSFKNYGVYGAKASWHIEHSIPRAKGGTDNLNNLFPACIPCNLEKGKLHNRTIRARKGTNRAPYSKNKIDKLKNDNATGFGAVGCIIGASVGGSFGAIFGALLGAEFGRKVSMKR
jgi:5-methylcytosine-specific restriction endonuclease McrA